VDGIQTSIVTFFLNLLPNCTVRLLVDTDGLVQRASMRAQRHCMEHVHKATLRRSGFGRATGLTYHRLDGVVSGLFRISRRTFYG
jgi:hypothetical protein